MKKFHIAEGYIIQGKRIGHKNKYETCFIKEFEGGDKSFFDVNVAGKATVPICWTPEIAHRWPLSERKIAERIANLANILDPALNPFNYTVKKVVISWEM